MEQTRRPVGAGTIAGALLLALALSLLTAPASAADVSAQQTERVENPTDACPDPTNPPAPFADRNGVPVVHRLNVDCAYNNMIARGFADSTYRPREQVRRDQFASFLVRTLRAGDVNLPQPADQGFTDVRGNPHEENINILAQTGIAAGRTETTYDPRDLLLRDQTATFILRAAAYVEGVSLASLQRPTGPFTDVPSTNVHVHNINGARHFNLTIGRTGTTYEPSSPTRRDQMASFLIRLLASLADDGHLIAPEDRVTGIRIETRVAANPVGTGHTATATAVDAVGDPVVGAPVRFEVFRHANPVVEPPAFTYLAQLQRTVTTDADGRASITYTGPNHPADDRIAVCVPRTTTQVPATGAFCGVVVDLEDGEGQTVVPTDVVPADVAQKKWGWPANALTADATGIRGQLLGSVLPAEPTSSVNLPGPAGQRSGEDRAGLEVGQLAPLLYVALLTTRAAGDLDFGIARAESQATDLELLGVLNGAPLVGADVIDTVNTLTCAGQPAELADVSDSTFVGLTIGGQEIPVDVPPNTGVTVPGVLEVVVNEVVPDPDPTAQRYGYTVRGLRITVLPPLGVGDPLAEIIVGDTHTWVDCAAPGAATAGSSAQEIGDGEHVTWTTLDDVDPRPWIDELERHTGRQQVSDEHRAELDERFGAP